MKLKMDKEIKELMQISIISENVELSKLIEDIKPNNTLNLTKKTEKIVQNETKPIVNKNQEFRIVIYKKENSLIKALKEIKDGIKKIMNLFGGKKRKYIKVK